MTKKYTGKYIVKWFDKYNTSKSKVYDDYLTAIKAQKWLLESGADNIDIAVQLEDKVVTSYYER